MEDGLSIVTIISLLPSLRSYALALTGSDHRAEDLVQDTLERAWRNRDRFISGASPKSWICTIMRNRFIDSLRQEKWTIQDVDGLSAAKLASNPSQQWSLQYSDLVREIGRLPLVLQEAVVLCWFGGLSHEDAAAVLNWPLGTLKARVRRARDALTQVLDLSEMRMTDHQG